MGTSQVRRLQRAWGPLQKEAHAPQITRSGLRWLRFGAYSGFSGAKYAGGDPFRVRFCEFRTPVGHVGRVSRFVPGALALRQSSKRMRAPASMFWCILGDWRGWAGLPFPRHSAKVWCVSFTLRSGRWSGGDNARRIWPHRNFPPTPTSTPSPPSISSLRQEINDLQPQSADAEARAEAAAQLCTELEARLADKDREVQEHKESLRLSKRQAAIDKKVLVRKTCRVLRLRWHIWELHAVQRRQSAELWRACAALRAAEKTVQEVAGRLEQCSVAEPGHEGQQ